jgi:lipoprotein-anchoring transpeptidase ErfK/SrfK
MDLDALRFANFALLDDAVEEWRLVAQNLETLAKDAQDGLRASANKANWSGENSQVTKEFIGKTAGEFQDAHTQATTIHNILKDTTSELKSYKGQLTDAIDRGLKKNLTVLDTGGGGFTVTMNVHPDRAAKGHTPPEHDASDVTALRDEVQGILSKATESDESARKVLTAIADQSALGFSDAKYADRDAAVDAVRDAEELAKLAKQKPEDLSPEEFDRLNAGLKEHAGDPLFSETFATTLGPQGVLDFWAGINDPHYGARLGHERVDQYGDLQKNLSLTLAAATQSDSPAMADWQTRMIALGDKPTGRDGYGPMGFQVMSNLMRAGDFDDSFLTRYGNALMQTERQLTGNGEHANMAWTHMGMDSRLNRMGDDSGDDPLTGYLKALSNSPDAATDFFNQEYVNKDDEDNPFERDTDGNGKKGAVSLSNFQYLFEERDWPKEYAPDGDEVHTGRNNLALALEAATTGHPAGELPTADTPAHSADQARLFEAITASVSEDAGRLTDHGYMSDSIGQITSEYLPDINRALTDDSDGDTDRLYPVSGTAAEVNHRDVTRLMFTLGQNPEAYAAVEVAQKTYMGNLMEYHLNPDLPESLRYSEDPQFVVEQVAKGSGEVSGTLAQGRAEEVAGEAEEKDKAYEQSVAQRKNIISGVVGTAAGVGTSFIASPVAGAAVSGVVGGATSVILEGIFADAEGNAKNEAGPVMGEHWETGKDSNAKYTELAAETAAKNYHLDLPDAGEWARDGAREGFTDSGVNVGAMAADLKTDI